MNVSSAKKRLFVAIPLPSAIIKALAGYSKQFPNLPHARWVPPENFHITVYFIGWVEEKNLPEIISRTQESILSIASFSLKFREVIWAPPSLRQSGASEGKSSSPRMIWALFERSAAFESLAEKESIPHVTLARFDASSKWRKIKIPQPKLENKIFKVDKILLMESKLSKTGPIYLEVASFYLERPARPSFF